jgi:hypothetical protein
VLVISPDQNSGETSAPAVIHVAKAYTYVAAGRFEHFLAFSFQYRENFARYNNSN